MKTYENTNSPGDPDPLYPDNENEKMTVEDEALYYDNGPESPHERHSNEAVKGVAWLFGIVAVFAVAILFAWIVGSHTLPVNDRSEGRMAEAQNLINKKAALADDGNVSAQFMAVLIPVSSAAPSTGTSQSATAVDKSKSSPSVAVSSDDESRIEREAREVIHGDFGDNPLRKEKLGADYAAVQARVNEILHN